MKPLYYLEFARSKDDNGQLIPAKELFWYVPSYQKIAYEDPYLCAKARYEAQSDSSKYVVRYRQASWFKNLRIRFSDDWVIIKE